MIPDIDLLVDELEEEDYSNGTYGITFLADKEDYIKGYIDDVSSVKQAIYLILNTERYEYPIYSWDYGIELVDLIGQPMPYIMSELARRVEEALTQDDRIESVKDFEFKVNGSKLYTKFTVTAINTDIPTELEVDI